MEAYIWKKKKKKVEVVEIKMVGVRKQAAERPSGITLTASTSLLPSFQLVLGVQSGFGPRAVVSMQEDREFHPPDAWYFTKRLQGIHPTVEMWTEYYDLHQQRLRQEGINLVVDTLNGRILVQFRNFTEQIYPLPGSFICAVNDWTGQLSSSPRRPNENAAALCSRLLWYAERNSYTMEITYLLQDRTIKVDPAQLREGLDITEPINWVTVIREDGGQGTVRLRTVPGFVIRGRGHQGQ